MNRYAGLLLGLTALAAGSVIPDSEAAKPIVPHGVMAMSAGEQVTLVQPAAPGVRSLETGTVGFLYPAPAGVLFAPDILAGRTSVIDVRSGRVVEVLSGVSLPHFGPRADRYLVVAGDLTMVSYPERSLIFRIEGEFDRPWEVLLGPEGTTVLILERLPSGEGGTTISAVDLAHRRVVYSRQFDHDLVGLTMLPEQGLMALVDRTSGDVVLLDSQTLTEIRRLSVPGQATDLGVVNEGKTLVVAGAEGALHRWTLKVKKAGVVFRPEKPLPLSGRGEFLAAGPSGRLLAVATDQGRLLVMDPIKGEEFGRWDIPKELRDFRWIDSDRRGPLRATWSDSGLGPEGADLGLDRDD